MSNKLLYLAAVAVIVGCAASGATSGATAPRRGTVLTADEIVAAHADNSNAHDALARLRPNWLVEHGVPKTDGTAYATVYVDGQQYGPLQTLRGIPAYQVDEIRYYDMTQAGARFGIRAGTGGVIEIKTKTR